METMSLWVNSKVGTTFQSFTGIIFNQIIYNVGNVIIYR